MPSISSAKSTPIHESYASTPLPMRSVPAAVSEEPIAEQVSRKAATLYEYQATTAFELTVPGKFSTLNLSRSRVLTTKWIPLCVEQRGKK